MRARVSGGTAQIDYRTLRVEDADEAVLVFAAATSFVDYKDVSADPAARVRDALSRVQDRTWDTLRADHEREHRSWFDRVALTLGPPTGAGADLPTDERIARFADHPDPGLAALYYQFGRYLLIASSRPGTQPANLQGIWNDNPNPWWDSKYTININLPMNYWPAETGNLQEMVRAAGAASPARWRRRARRRPASTGTPAAGSCTRTRTCGAPPPPWTVHPGVRGPWAARGS